MYFKDFPNILYPVRSDQLQQAKDLLIRLGFSQSNKDQSSTYTDYIVEEGQTPENISQQVYGDTQYHWVILLINDLLDPQYSFPLRSRSLEDYIDKKYPTNTFFIAPEDGVVGPFTGEEDSNTFREGDTVTTYIRTLVYGDQGVGRKLGTIRRFIPQLSAIQMWYYEGVFKTGDILVRGYDGELRASIVKIVNSKDAVHHFSSEGKILNPYATPPSGDGVQVPIGSTGEGFTEPVIFEQTILHNYIFDNNTDYVVSNRDYEFSVNETKRRIKLLRPELIENTTRELKAILRS